MIIIQAKKFKKTLSKIKPFIMNDEARPGHSSLLMIGKKRSSTLELVATDGCNLGIYFVKVNKPLEAKFEGMLPNKQVSSIARGISKNMAEIGLNIVNDTLTITDKKNVVCTSELVIGSYPAGVTETIDYTRGKKLLWSITISREVKDSLAKKLKAFGVGQLKNLAIWLEANNTTLTLGIKEKPSCIYVSPTGVVLSSDTIYTTIGTLDNLVVDKDSVGCRVVVCAKVFLNKLNLQDDLFTINYYGEPYKDFLINYRSEANPLEFESEYAYSLTMQLNLINETKYPELYT